MDKKYDNFNVHKTIKEITYQQKNTTSAGILKDNKLQIWADYIRDIFHNDRGEKNNENMTVKTEPPILREVQTAIKNTRGAKATGPDQLPIELIKLSDEDLIDIVVDLVNLIYSTGTIPQQWLQSTFVPIPKTPSATNLL